MQFLYLPTSSQQVAAVFKGPTSQRPARIQRLPFNGYHTNGILVFSRNGNSMVNMVYHQSSPQQIIGKPLILCRNRYQFTGHANNPRLFQRTGIVKDFFILHAGQRQERSPSIFILFQKSNHFLGCIFVVCNDILNAAAQSRLNSCLIAFFHLQKVCHNTPDAGYLLLLFHNPTNTISVSIITLCNITQRFQSGSLSVISCLPHLQLLGTSGYLRLIFLNLIFAAVSLPDKFFDGFFDFRLFCLILFL